MDVRHRLEVLHRQLESCRACPAMHGPPVHGPPIVTPILLIGQAPGPREGALGRPFAWTAGKTLFKWFHGATGVDEDSFRAGIYISAIARCFPGKASGGGDRRPDPGEIARCQRFLSGEVTTLRPQLVIPVGGLAIEQVLGHKGPLVDIIGDQRRVTLHGVDTDVICLPHPSGASTWHRVEPGISLLAAALARIAAHPAFVATFSARAPHIDPTNPDPHTATATPNARPTTANPDPGTTIANLDRDARTATANLDARAAAPDPRTTTTANPDLDARTTPAKPDPRPRTTRRARRPDPREAQP